MQLILEVISANGAALGGNRRKVVGPEGATIGRARENDWVISSQYLSRVHAQVRCVSGVFYIEGTGRNPLAVNSPSQPIPNNQPQLLRDGDRIFLDEFEVQVTISANAASVPAAPPPIADPFAAPAVAEPAKIPVGAMHSWEPDIVDADAGEAAGLDPLAALGMSAARRETPFPEVNIHQPSVLDEHFRAPQPVRISSDRKPGGSEIPDSWDRSGHTNLGKPRPATKKPVEASPAAPSQIPDAWDKTRLTHIEAPRPPARPSLPADVKPLDAELTLPPRAGTDVHKSASPRPTPRAPAAPQSPATPAPADPPTERRPALASSPAATGSVSLEELLRAAGVGADHMSPELASELGQVLRIVVEGLMEILQSRAEIKSQMRMNMTRMQAAENNPLKFSPNVEAALHTLLVERNRGYLPTTRAFEEALFDIRNHQMAVLQGMRAAFDSMLEQFDPEQLGEEFEGKTGPGATLRKIGAKLRFQDAYAERFAKLTRDPDESFRTLFGEKFAQAYEEQMERLKTAARARRGK